MLFAEIPCLLRHICIRLTIQAATLRMALQGGYHVLSSHGSVKNDPHIPKHQSKRPCPQADNKQYPRPCWLNHKKKQNHYGSWRHVMFHHPTPTKLAPRSVHWRPKSTCKKGTGTAVPNAVAAWVGIQIRSTKKHENANMISRVPSGKKKGCWDLL